MNVFEFLGLPANHRTTKKVVQLVKHIQEVPVSKIKFPLFAQTKKDGVFCMVVSYQGKYGIFGRTGKMLTNVDWLVQRWDNLPSGVYIGELCCDECSLEVLSGITNPNRVNELDDEQLSYCHKFYIAFHDHLFISEFAQGQSDRCYQVRHRSCEYQVGTVNTLPVHIIRNMEDAEKYAANRIAWGEEGAVFKNMEVGYIAGHKGYHAMKIVRGVDYDLLCVGFEEGTGKYSSKIANLVFQWKNGDFIKAMLGKGWTHDMAAEMFDVCEALKLGLDFEDMPEGSEAIYPVGKIFKVHALQESSKGKLRLPKVKEIRTDKELPDV